MRAKNVASINRVTLIQKRAVSILLRTLTRCLQEKGALAYA